MQDLSIYKALTLPAGAKEVLEKLLGRRLEDDEDIAIWASRPHTAPVGEARREAWRQMDVHLDRMALKASGSPNELEELVDQVCDEVRHRPQ